MRDFDGQCWTQNLQWEANGKPVDPAQWGIKQLISEAKPGLSRKQGVIHTGQNGGYQAVNLAYLLGARRIILVGYDMMMCGEQRHWFGDHPPPFNAASPYPQFVKNFTLMNPQEYGLEVWNCSRRTALTCFPNYDLDALCSVL